MIQDIENVIKGLEICSAGEWNSTGGRDHTDCPYYPAGYTGCTCKLLMRDALALLKAQEPVEPTEPDEDNTRYCGACGSAVGYEVLEPPGISYIKYNYCPMCGKPVKWE